MSVTRPISALIVSYLLFATSGAYAWWQSGHEAICDFALRSMTPNVRAQIEDLLEEPFPKACGWADDVRPDRPETSPWHYINSTPKLTSFKYHPRPASGDILTAIAQQSHRLQHSKNPEMRAEALRWLGHLVGDLHQPMHVAFEEDWGGNRYQLALPSALQAQLDEARSTVNMHAIWDGLILRQAVVTKGKPVVSLLKQTDLPEQDNPVLWADEGLAILHRPDVHYWPGTRIEILSEDYLNTHRDLVLQRLSLAGLRLAALLNDLMSAEAHQSLANDESSSR